MNAQCIAIFPCTQIYPCLITRQIQYFTYFPSKNVSNNTTPNLHFGPYLTVEPNLRHFSSYLTSSFGHRAIPRQATHPRWQCIWSMSYCVTITWATVCKNNKCRFIIIQTGLLMTNDKIISSTFSPSGYDPQIGSFCSRARALWHPF